MDNFRLLQVNFGLFSPVFDHHFYGVRFGLQTLSTRVHFLSFSHTQSEIINCLFCCIRVFCPVPVPFCLHMGFLGICIRGVISGFFNALKYNELNYKFRFMGYDLER